MGLLVRWDGGGGVCLMDFASQTEEEHTDVAFEKGTITNGH